MYLNSVKRIQFKRRPAILGYALAGLFCVFTASSTYAQERAGGDAPSRFMERIDQEEGVRRMAAFRGQRLEGDYCFRFELEHLPRRGKATTYYGTMWGSWNEVGPVTRIELIADNSDTDSVQVHDTIELIIQNGIDSKVWSRKNREGAFVAVSDAGLFEPVIPGIVYSAFDLQMPFIYWDQFTYEGPSRVQSRVAQQFLMFPPEDDAALDRGIGAVRVGLDDTYDALLRVEVLNTAGEELSRFTVESFKKVQGQYIVKEVTLKDYASKDRTRFKVKAASVGLGLNDLIFKPCYTEAPFGLPNSMFDVL